MCPFFYLRCQLGVTLQRYIIKGIAMMVFVGLVATAMVGNWIIRFISNS